MPWSEIVFYKEGETVLFDQWLNTLPVKVQAKRLSQVRMLRSQGHELRRPIADFLRDGIYEFARHLEGVGCSGFRNQPGSCARMEGVIMTTKKKEALDQLIDKFVGNDPERGRCWMRKS